MKRITSTLTLFLAVCMIAVTMSGCLFHRHTIVDDEPIAPTCTVDGLTGASHCSECGKQINAGTVVSATGHTPVEDAAEDPTCSVTGKTAGSHCSVCHAVLTAQTEIPMIPHTYVSKVEQPFSCTADGVERFICSVCEDSYTAPYVRRTYTPTELFDLASASIAEINIFGQGGKLIGSGSGFVISPDGKILTSYHLIDLSTLASVMIGGKKYNLKTVETYDIVADIAIIKIDAEGLPFLPICKQEHGIGSAVYAFGVSEGASATFTNGNITGACEDIGGFLCVRHNASISEGNVGGPLLNEYGEIIGVSTFAVDASQGLNYAISAKELDNLEHMTPETLASVRDREFDPYLRLFNYLKRYGEKADIGEGIEIYGIGYDEEYDENGTLCMTRTLLATENEVVHTVNWEMLSEDMTLTTVFSIDQDRKWIYLYYADSDGNEIETTILGGYTLDKMLIEPINTPSMTSDEAREIAELFFTVHLQLVDADISAPQITVNRLQFPTTV